MNNWHLLALTVWKLAPIAAIIAVPIAVCLMLEYQEKKKGEK